MVNYFDNYTKDPENFLSWIEFLEVGVYRDQSPYLKFAVLWLSFAGYLLKRYPDKDHDIQRLKAFCADPINIRIYSELINSEDYYQKVSSFRNIPTDNGNPRESIKEVGKLNPKESIFRVEDYRSFDMFIMVIYKIRCNFFHGGKIPFNNSDREIVAWAYHVFLIFWKNCINKTILDTKSSPKSIQKRINSNAKS